MPLTITYVIEQDGRPEISDQDEARLITQFSQDLCSIIRSTNQKERRAADIVVEGPQPQLVDVTTSTDQEWKMTKVFGVEREETYIHESCCVGKHQMCPMSMEMVDLSTGETSTKTCACPCHRTLGPVQDIEGDRA